MRRHGELDPILCGGFNFFFETRDLHVPVVSAQYLRRQSGRPRVRSSGESNGHTADGPRSLQKWFKTYAANPQALSQLGGSFVDCVVVMTTLGRPRVESGAESISGIIDSASPPFSHHQPLNDFGPIKALF